MSLIEELRAQTRSQGSNKQSKIDLYLDSLDAKDRKEWISVLMSYDHSNRAIAEVLKTRGVTLSPSAVQLVRSRLRDSATNVAKK
jgi:hypothetical protein